MHPARSESYRSWLVGELVLVAALAAGTVLLATIGALDGYVLPEGRIALETAVAVVGTIVAILAGVRFLVEGRALDLLLAAGFATASARSFVFGLAPAVAGAGEGVGTTAAAMGAEVVAAALVLAAAFTRSRVAGRRRALVAAIGGIAIALTAIWFATGLLDARVTSTESRLFPVGYAVLAVLALAATVGFGLRFRQHGRDLDSWLALALTLIVFADLHYVLSQTLTRDEVVQGDFLRLLAYAVLLVGVWRAIGQAEFGRAVAEERARVAREIHDGLAQYLFAVSTHVTMLESGAPLDTMLPRLKSAAAAAQQEARFAVLALSSASGSAPFDAALRRYVEVLTADGALDVELEIDPSVPLAADEQIEVFRIVQEGLANARRHAGATHAEVTIGNRSGRRVVVVSDDGAGFDGDGKAAGQGLKNMRLRAESIEGGLTVRSEPGAGTAIEVVLRAA